MADLFNSVATDDVAFVGTYEFRIAFELLGKRMVRQARAEYRYTPDWPYYDPQIGAPRVGRWSSIIGLSVKIERPRKKRKSTREAKRKRRKPKATWERIDIAEIGVLDDEVWDLLREKIDERCQLEDAERRRRAAKRKTAPK